MVLLQIPMTARVFISKALGTIGHFEKPSLVCLLKLPNHVKIQCWPPPDTHGRPCVWSIPARSIVHQGYGSARCRSDHLQIVRRGLACPSIGDNVESDLLSLVEDTHASAFDRADVHEDILAAIIRLNKAEAFLVIEELHGSLGHMISSFHVRVRPHVSAADLFEIWRKVVSPDAGCAARPSRSAEARLLQYGH